MRKTRAKARAIEGSQEWGFANTGTEQVGIRVLVLDGELKDQTFTWYGYFTENSETRTLEQLMIAGWDGQEPMNLPGLGATEFELQLEEQEEQDEQGNVTGAYWRPTFINRVGVAMRNKMDDGQKRAFASRLSALARTIQKPATQQSGQSARTGTAPAGGAGRSGQQQRNAAPQGGQPQRQREPGDDGDHVDADRGVGF